MSDTVEIPRETYLNLIRHLQAHAPNDEWANQCLKQLSSVDVEDKVVPVFEREALVV